MKNASPYFHSVSLVVWTLTLLKRGRYSELSLQGCTLHFRISDLRSEKSMLKKWPSGHKSNAESSQIICSFISILYQLDPPGGTDAKPQFASKISSLHVSNNPRTHSPRHATVETVKLVSAYGVVPYFLRVVINIPIQTLSFSPWRLLHRMIVSQLELGPPVSSEAVMRVN